MRTIKFRGYNRKNKEWLYGFYLQNRGAHFVCPDEFANGKTWVDYEVDPETVGQFTGLHDKNGKEIYEGDIIQGTLMNNKKLIGLAMFYGGCFFFKCTNGHSDEYLVHINDKIIISNIHDNSELLKGDLR